MIGGFDDVMARGGMPSLYGGYGQNPGANLPGPSINFRPASENGALPHTLAPTPLPPTGGFDPAPPQPAPQLTPEQQLLNKGPKAVWDDWIARMGGFLAATPRETPGFGAWNYHFGVPGIDEAPARPKSRFASLDFEGGDQYAGRSKMGMGFEGLDFH